MSATLRAISVAALLALSACAGSMVNQWGPERLVEAKPGDNTGVVLLSTGAPGSCLAFSTFLKIIPDGVHYKAGMKTGELAMVAVDTSYSKSDFSDHHGFVHAVRLPAGRYYLAPWLANHMMDPVYVPRYDFSIGLGEVVYLGEYLMSASCSAGTAATIVDRWERDRALIAQRNQSINLSQAVVRPAAVAGAALGKAE